MIQMADIPAIKVLGVKVNPVTRTELEKLIGNAIESGERHIVLNVNIHCMNLAQRNPWLKELLNSVRLVFCDGAGVMWAARILGHRIPERITYADWLWELADYCQKKDYSLYFLGARPGIARRAAENLKKQFPKLKIVGCRDGFFDMSGDQNEEVLASINRAGPQILLVGMGMPRQEYWLYQNRTRLEVPIALTGGACFDFVSGAVRRCPPSMANHSLEWLYRLYIEPSRMFCRYLIGNPLFLVRVLIQKLMDPRPNGENTCEWPNS